MAVDLADTVRRLLTIPSDRRVQQRLCNCLTEVQYILENDLLLVSAFVGEIRRTVQQRKLLAENDGLCTTNAFDEALANAYYHGNLELSSDVRQQDATAYYTQADQHLFATDASL